MSLDFQLAFPCPHLTIEERVALDDDRRGLMTRQPVTSGNFVQISANDIVAIPQEGLLSSARVESAFAGPFTIKKGLNTVTISNARGSLVGFALPVGTRIATDRVVELLTAAFRNRGLGILALSSNGALVLSDLDDKGPESRVDVRGLATESLGYTGQRAAKGKDVYPAWVMAARDDVINTVNINQFVRIETRFPRFVAPVQGNPVFKVTYATMQQRCRRCQTTAVENDYRFNDAGEALMIGNENLLNQSLLKILLTIRSSNPFHTNYGSTLVDQIGQKALLGSQITINEDVLRTIRLFQRLQTLQSQFQAITSRERLLNVLSINVLPSTRDPTVFKVNIVATNASGEPVNITTVFTVPGAAALVGSNGLSLGLGGFGLAPGTTATDIFGDDT